MRTTNTTLLLLRCAARRVARVPVLFVSLFAPLFVSLFVPLFVGLFAAFSLSACSSDSNDDPAPADDPTTIVTLTLQLNAPQSITNSKPYARDGVPADDAGVAQSNAFTRATTFEPTGSTDDNKHTWDPIDNPEAGNAYEDNIEANRLIVIFYDEDGQYLARVNSIRATQADQSATGDAANTVTIEGIMETGLNDATYEKLFSSNGFNGTVAVFANIDDPSTTDPDYWSNSSHTLNYVTTNTAYTYTPTTATTTANGATLVNGLSSIPMFGFRKFDTSDANKKVIKRAGHTDLGVIPVLRAMAKVSVELTKEMIDAHFTLQSVSLKNYNTSGMVAPSYSKFFKDNYYNILPLTYANSFNLPSSPGYNSGSISFVATDGTNEQTTSLNLYIPEYRNVEESSTNRLGTLQTNAATISVTIHRNYDDGQENYTRKGTLQFCDYTDGTANTSAGYDIVRNHHYHYYIYSKELDVKVKVEKWNVIDTHKVKEI